MLPVRFSSQNHNRRPTAPEAITASPKCLPTANPSSSLTGFLPEMEYDDRFTQAQRPKYDCLLFDLDDTLYPLSRGIAKACGQNIKDYMVEKLGIERSKIDELSNLHYKNYGTTMAGLRMLSQPSLPSPERNQTHVNTKYRSMLPRFLRGQFRTLFLSSLDLENIPYAYSVFNGAGTSCP